MEIIAAGKRLSLILIYRAINWFIDIVTGLYTSEFATQSLLITSYFCDDH